MNPRAVLLLLAVATGSPAATVTLYDGAAGVPLFPWIAGGPQAAFSSGGGGVTIDTTSSDSTQAGYFRADTTFDRAQGYTLRFDLDLLSEDHSNPAALNNADSIAERAGFSLIALGNDLRGVELAFWMTEVWAQNDGLVKADPVLAPSGTRFTHGEGVPFDFSGAVVRFDLSVLGNGYTLSANGAPLLSGALRDYSNEGAPYTTPNFLFFGDNTTSANGSAKVNLITFTDSAVPEPGSFALLLMGTLAFAAAQRVRSRG